MSSEDLAARITEAEAPKPEAPSSAPGSEGTHGEDSPPDLSEVTEFLTEAGMWGIERGFGVRAQQAGAHWNVTDPERAKLTPPVSRLAQKWAPKVAAFMPGMLMRFKEEAALCLLLASMVYARAKVDAELAAAAADAQHKGASDGGQEGAQG